MKKLILTAMASIASPVQADLLTIETHFLPEQALSCGETEPETTLSPALSISTAVETPRYLRFGFGASNTGLQCSDNNLATTTTVLFAFVGGHKTWLSGQHFALSTSAAIELLMHGYKTTDTDSNSGPAVFPQIDPVRIAFDSNNWQLRLSLMKIPELTPGIHIGYKF